MEKKESLPFSLDPLDPKFVPAKPRQEIDEEEVLKLEKEGKVIYTRKRDGNRLFAATTNRIRLYTSGINDVTDNYPHIIAEIKKMKLPKDTLLDGEVFVQVDGKDNLPLIGSIMKNKPEKSKEIQKSNPAHYMIFDVPVLEGKELFKETNLERIQTVHRFFSRAKFSPKFIFPVEILTCPLKEAQEIVRANNWEGLVIYVKDGVSDFRVDGRPNPRPKTCWKWKPLKEDDFIVREKIWVPEGDNQRLKEVVLTQIDFETGKEFYCAKLGGFEKEIKKYLADAELPLVMQVEFMSRHESGKLREPRFMRLRDDKKPDECIYKPE